MITTLDIDADAFALTSSIQSVAFYAIIIKAITIAALRVWILLCLALNDAGKWLIRNL